MNYQILGVVIVTSQLMFANPISLIMASDTAVTVNGMKTFTGFQKQFHISSNPPIGMMVSGNSEFGGIPIETIVAEFKKKYGEKFISVEETSKAFIEFAGTFSNPDSLDLIIDELIYEIIHMTSQEYEEFLDDCRNIEPLPFLLDYDFPDLDFISKNEFLRLLSFWILYNETEVVMAGFDLEYNRPSFINFKLIFNNNGKAECRIIEKEVNFNDFTLKTYAQDKEINDFIYGIDGDVHIKIIRLFTFFMHCYSKDIKNALNQQNNNFDDLTLDKINCVIDNINTEDYMVLFEESINSSLTDNYWAIMDIVGVFPPKILIKLADFLIYIVSIKRMYSFDLETVGGENTITLITKNEIRWATDEEKL